MSSSIHNGTRDAKIAVSTTTQEESWERKQIVLMLCGLIASGKSTFAIQLQQHFPQFLRCNQDDLGSRRDVERLARQGLRNGMSVCIDRTNFNALQRSYWIEIAREFPGTLICLIVFDVPYETCVARLRERKKYLTSNLFKVLIRHPFHNLDMHYACVWLVNFANLAGTSHPTIKNAEQGLSVLARFAAEFKHPHPDEGYDRIIHLRASDHLGPIYSRSDISVILRRVWDSVPVTPTGIPRSLQMQHYYSQQSNHIDLTRDDMQSSSQYQHHENGMFAAERSIRGGPFQIGALPSTRGRTNHRQGGRRHLWPSNETIYRPV